MAANRIRVLTWNILEGGMDGRFEGILRTLRSLKPDVVALQECNGWHQRGAKLLRRAERALKMAGFPFWTTHGYQPALLTRIPGAKAIAHDDQDHFHLGYQEVRLPLPGGRTWHFFNTHLNPFAEVARLAEIKTVARAMKPHFGAWCSLTGDLNSLSSGDLYGPVRMRPRTRIDLNRYPLFRTNFNHVGLCGLHGYGDIKEPTKWMRVPFRVRRMKDTAALRTDATRHLKRAGWIDLYRRLHPRVQGHTLPSENPYARIDYVWLSPTLARRAVSCEVLYGRRLAKLSDHCPLLWEVDVR
ncbi:MAG: endonuclease/exonuclease/phosphatase family protein [Planctomycetes bacterium]|nr:endonuclease/exonuclease/phosphatase family protein [Planctomycetota bacterium]